MEYLRRLAQEADVEASDEELRRADRKRKKKASNDDGINLSYFGGSANFGSGLCASM